MRRPPRPIGALGGAGGLKLELKATTDERRKPPGRVRRVVQVQTPPPSVLCDQRDLITVALLFLAPGSFQTPPGFAPRPQSATRLLWRGF